MTYGTTPHSTILITGASSGIGLALARVCAENGHNLALVARDAKGLSIVKRQLESKHKIQVHTFAQDLTILDAADAVFAWTKKEHITVDILINNAGFGDWGPFAQADEKRVHDMAMLNMVALTELTHRFTKAMIARRRGRVLNVASVAGFFPGPLMSEYYATKAYVLSFSEGLANELAPHGISVTALCPGPTQTNFKRAANLNGSKLFANKNIPTAEEVAHYGYTAMMRGKRIAIHGIRNRIMIFAVRFLPRRAVAVMVRRAQERR